MKKKIIFTLGIALAAVMSTASVKAQNNFDKDKVLFISQYDSIPDDDDIQSQAAVASLLAHPDFEGVNFFAVSGAWGEQFNNSLFAETGFIDSSSLFDLGYGREATLTDNATQRANSRWVDAHGNGGTNSAERIANLDFASDVVAEKARPILEAGGRVFVMEAGQSDITADWIRKLHDQGVPNVSNNVIVVQHSTFNQNQTTNNDLNYVRNGQNNRYVFINSGNSGGNQTPNYNRSSGNSLAISDLDTNTPPIYPLLQSAISSENPNARTREIWAEATRITSEISRYTLLRDNNGNFIRRNAPIRSGGLDFSDSVEAMWIFDIADEEDGFHEIEEFWSEFVIYDPNPNSNPVVTLRKQNAPDFAIDGNNGGANGQNVYLWNFNPNNVNQQFIEIDRGNGFYSYVKQGTNFALDGGSGGARGQNVNLWEVSETNFNQQWRKISKGGNTYQLQKRNALGFSIDGDAGGARRQNIYLWRTLNNNQNQQWIIEEVN